MSSAAWLWVAASPPPTRWVWAVEIVIAQSGRRGDPIDVVVTVGILVAVVVGAGVAIMAIRRRLLSKSGALEAAGSLLDSLRAMRDRGEMTDEEYEAARVAARDRMAERLTGRPPGPGLGGIAPPAVGGKPLRVSASESGSGLIAPPGFDLTGRPLPKPADPRR